MGALLPNQNSFVYKRREPEKNLLYSALSSGIESWLAEGKDDISKTQLPDFVEKEFRGFRRCGLLQYGFVALECPGCKTKVPVAYSCRHRGFSCLPYMVPPHARDLSIGSSDKMRPYIRCLFLREFTLSALMEFALTFLIEPPPPPLWAAAGSRLML